MENRVGCEWSYSQTVNYGMQQNQVPIVKSIIVTNNTEEEIRDVTIKITSEPLFVFEWSKTYDVLPVDQAINLGAIQLQMSASFLSELSERVTGTLNLTILQGESVLHEERANITVLAYDEWSGLAVLPELLAAFVTPNHYQISQVIREAADILGTWTGSPSFSAYQSKDPNRVRIQAAAIYTALQNKKIAYCVAPASFELIGQRVRLPETVFSHRMGNCLDLTLLYTACIEAIGLNPLIICIEGHAFSGVWLEEETFPESIQDDISVLTKRIAKGINQICVIESTAFVEGSAASFDEAAISAEKHLQSPEKFDCLIDIKRARAAAIRPLPLRTATKEGWVIEQLTQSQIETAVAPELLEVLEKPLEVDVMPKATRQKQWERRLLDLTLRNTLLNFRLSKSSIPVISTQLGDLEDALADGEEFQMLAKPNDWQNEVRDANLFQSIDTTHPLAHLLHEEFKQKRLRVDLSPLDLERRLIHLYRSAKSSLEENGANTLYLALGLLKWYETPSSERPRYAPIVLLPVDIVRKSSRLGYIIRARDEEPQMNVTLLEMLKQDFGIAIDGLDPLPKDEKGIALKQIFNVFRHGLIHVSRWDIEEVAYLGLFSFGQFVMWNDIRKSSEKLAENKVVASLMEGKLTWQEQVSESGKELDDDHPSELALPISADSSQLSAIHAAMEGQSFVLHGPPGTGKSQTITNMITSALAQGKRVLFVAEKMAALSVVERRLDQIGLGPFCLELHSNKSTKKSVLDQLSLAMETGRVSSSEAWSNQADRLFQLRSELNTYVNALHHKHRFGLTLYEAISQYEAAGEGPDVVQFDQHLIVELDEQRLVAWKDIASQLQIAGAQCEDPHLHPWSDSQLTLYTNTLKSEAETLLKAYIAKITKLQSDSKQLASWLKLESDSLDYKKLETLVQLSELITRIPEVKQRLIATPNLEETLLKLRTLAEQGENRDTKRALVYAKYEPSSLEHFDGKDMLHKWESLDTQWFFAKWSGQQRIYKLMNRLASPHTTISKNSLENDLREIASWQKEEKILDKAITECSSYLNHTLLWTDGGNWEDILKVSDWFEKLQAALNNWMKDQSMADKARTEMAEVIVNIGQNELQNQTLQYVIQGDFEAKESEQELGRLLYISFDQIRIDSQASDWHTFMIEKSKHWLTNLESLRDWSTWRRVRSQAEELGLLALVTPYEQGQLSNMQLVSSFERGLYKALVNYIIAQDESLITFSGDLFEETIKRFKESDASFLKLTQQEIVARLSSKVPQMTQEAAQSSEAGILQRAIRSGGRSLSIRKLFEQIPNLLPRLTPCMLMSPISVAQYLDPNGAKFDLVIFDEASQVATSQAVGALARGKQAVIVGDPKQLPPTSFFSKGTSEVEEDDQVLQDMESILDDCLALGMPERHLSWHYRSRHESLIAFSNSNYYDNKLLTFPSPDEPISSVKWYPVEGFYDRGRTKQNRAEGEAVVAEIIKRLHDPVLNRLSIGVVTFSSIQQTLIEDMLEETIRQDEELELLLANLPEPIFVKNLENVQGDERDVILFSVGYGPDSLGKVSLNFGPLNRQGGWRRLNVAVSRARHEMLVFSTLRSHHLHGDRVNAQGVLGLKAFLEYAEKGKRVLALSGEVNHSPSVSHLHRSIAKHLKLRGYDVDLYVGASGYRVDLGILDDEQKDQYILGIILDGPMYKNADVSRDRNILREQVLLQLGWSLQRVWSPEWWENKHKIIRKIVEAIELTKKTKLNQLSESIVSSENQTGKDDQVQLIQNERIDEPVEIVNIGFEAKVLKGYRYCELESISLGAEMFHVSQNNKLVIEQINKVINEEGPISRALLIKRILQAWGITRSGARIEKRFSELMRIIKPQTVEFDGIFFYWPDLIQPNQYDIFRVSVDDSQRRTAEELPPEEIATAIKYVLASQISLPQEELVKQVAKVLGYARSGSALAKVISIGIQIALEREYVLHDEQQRIVIK